MQADPRTAVHAPCAPPPRSRRQPWPWPPACTAAPPLPPPSSAVPRRRRWRHLPPRRRERCPAPPRPARRKPCSPTRSASGHFQPPELAQEINGLGDPQDSPLRQMQIGDRAGPSPHSRQPGARRRPCCSACSAQNQAQAQPLHPLARMLLAQQAETRRLEDQLERQNQQTKEANGASTSSMTAWKPCARIERSLRDTAGRHACPRLPARPASDTMNDVASKAPAAQPRLLVVDDDADMLRLLSMRLNSAGYRSQPRPRRNRR